MGHRVRIESEGACAWTVAVVLASCGALAACAHGSGSGGAAARGATAAAPAPAVTAPAATSSSASAPVAAAPAPPAYVFARSIDAAALAAARSSAAPPLVLDVRSADEFATGHVPGAINVPHDQVEARLAELAAQRDRQIVLYCRSGRRAGMAAEVLQRHGFEDLAHLEGDMPGWVAAGQPVEKP